MPLFRNGLGFDSDVEFAHYLAREIGVACVPGSGFYHDPAAGARYERFCFCKREETLTAESERLDRLRP